MCRTFVLYVYHIIDNSQRQVLFRTFVLNLIFVFLVVIQSQYYLIKPGRAGQHTIALRTRFRSVPNATVLSSKVASQL